ncbi:unnamed protein product [Camellia sinensis]
MHSLSVTRSYGVGDFDPQVGKSLTRDSTYRPSRPSSMSRYSFSARSRDLRDVLEARARRKETQRLTALQRLSSQIRSSEEVAMSAPRVVAPALVDKDLARLTAAPLSPEIENTPLSARFHQPKFTLYDGETDPYMHARHYRQVMAGHQRNDALMCLIFPASLGEMGLKWFERLPEGSIEG